MKKGKQLHHHRRYNTKPKSRNIKLKYLLSPESLRVIESLK